MAQHARANKSAPPGETYLLRVRALTFRAGAVLTRAHRRSSVRGRRITALLPTSRRRRAILLWRRSVGLLRRRHWIRALRRWWWRAVLLLLIRGRRRVEWLG